MAPWRKKRYLRKNKGRDEGVVYQSNTLHSVG
jgi:hypothetical protein